MERQCQCQSWRASQYMLIHQTEGTRKCRSLHRQGHIEQANPEQPLELGKNLQAHSVLCELKIINIHIFRIQPFANSKVLQGLQSEYGTLFSFHSAYLAQKRLTMRGNKEQIIREARTCNDLEIKR